MHIRREIDHILDEINEIIAKNKDSNKEKSEDKAMIEHLERTTMASEQRVYGLKVPNLFTETEKKS